MSFSEVVVRIQVLSTQFPEVRVILEREAHYFEKHVKRIRYQEYREKVIRLGVV